MYSAGSSAELIELFFLNSWELLGRGQMPLGTRCVFCVSVCVCVSLPASCALATRYVAKVGGQSLCVRAKEGENLRCYVGSAWHAGRWSVSGAFSGLQPSLVGRLSH